MATINFTRATDAERRAYHGDYPLYGYANVGSCRVVIEKRIRHNGKETFVAASAFGGNMTLYRKRKATAQSLAGLLRAIESDALAGVSIN